MKSECNESVRRVYDEVWPKAIRVPNFPLLKEVQRIDSGVVTGLDRLLQASFEALGHDFVLRELHNEWLDQFFGLKSNTPIGGPEWEYYGSHRSWNTAVKSKIYDTALIHHQIALDNETDISYRERIDCITVEEAEYFNSDWRIEASKNTANGTYSPVAPSRRLGLFRYRLGAFAFVMDAIDSSPAYTGEAKELKEAAISVVLQLANGSAYHFIEDVQVSCVVSCLAVKKAE